MAARVQQSKTGVTTRLVLNKGSLEDAVSSVGGDSGYGGPKLSPGNPKSFDQQVKRAIEEASRVIKAKLSSQLLRDQADRVESIKPMMVDTSEQKLLSVDTDRLRGMSSIMDRARGSRSSAVSKRHYTSSGKKLQDTSIQAVITQGKLGSGSVLGARTGASRRSLQMQQGGQSSSGGLVRSQNGIKAAPLWSKGARLRSAPKVTSGALGSASGLLAGSMSKMTVRSNISAEIKVTAGSESQSSEFRPAGQGSMQTFAGSRLFQSGSDSRTKLITESSKVNNIQRDLEVSESARIPMDTDKQSSVQNISAGRLGSQVQSSRSIQPGFGSNNKDAPQGSRRGSSFLKYKFVRESMNVFGVAQAELKHPKKNSKILHRMPAEVIQAVSGHVSQRGSSAKYPGRKSSSKTDSALGQCVSASSKNAIPPDEESSAVPPTDSLMEKMLKYCHCSVEEPGEDKTSEVKFDFASFKKSSENVAVKGPKIINVARSPFERKDRAARAAFAKELEQMEIAAIEKKQRLKPKKIKKDLKKVGVYDTIKHICRIPDSYADSARGSPLHSSVATGVFGLDVDSPSRADSSASGSHGSSVILDKLQLRKENSLASRNTGGNTGELNKEDAFHEIELSEESDFSHRSVASSSCEIISSSSEISLRVNLDKTQTNEECKAMKLKTAPFVNYQNRMNGEQAVSDGKSNVKILDANLEGIIIEKIATEFGEWAKENGVKPEAVEKDVIKELFQFGTMDTAANSIAVEIKELIIVPESITNGMHPELEERAAMYRQILFDEGAYWRTERSMAFGKPDPKPYKRPPHPPLPTWTESGFVPQPLATGELLYQTLIDNDSL